MDMKSLLNKLSFGLILATASWTSHAAELTWADRLPKGAKAQAKTEKKSVTAFLFMDRIWCPPCLLMHAAGVRLAGNLSNTRGKPWCWSMWISGKQSAKARVEASKPFTQGEIQRWQWKGTKVFSNNRLVE